jgi:RNA polymerase sigma factor (sigma-70 family)
VEGDLETNSGTSASNRDLQAHLDVEGTGALSDGQLLDRFVARREEPVFEAIVLRHGPMVWGVCRRVLRDHHDAEDALQATFLILARKAASVRPREKLGNWLYGVAYLTAKKATVTRAKRRSLDSKARENKARESKVLDMPFPEADRGDPLDELLPQLDRELSRLPDKYRAPVVLCELEGKSHKEAAEQLGWPIGTVSGRLSRARGILAKKLSRRGVAVSGGSLAVLLAENALSASVPTTLVGSTAQAASLLMAGHAATAGMVSAEVAALTGEVLKTMLLSKIAVTSVLVGLAGLGGSGIYYGAQAAMEASRPKQGPAQKLSTAVAGRATNPTVDDVPKNAGKADVAAVQKPPSTPAASPVAPVADDAAKLQGTWDAIAIEVNGTRVGKDEIEVKSTRFVIEGDRLTIPGVEAATQKRAEAGGPARKKTFTLDTTKSPKEINLTSLDGREKGETAACIYKFEDGRLTVCLASAEQPNTRPKEFKTAAGDGIILITLERVTGK